ncbi:MAG: hypothetical protein A2Y15_03310 [Clostridiales bacterium GWF2_36_10]|nr:MAG: hypothetical protein A2Y15_03310 [Clostridiales bacterium GWF2_36_10]HAN20153.1 hypothetical protein [Clostridiales bacterium]
MSKYISVEGKITSIEPIRTGEDRQENCCNLLISVRTDNRNVIKFFVDNDTYFIDNVNVRRGDNIIAFYDSSLLVPLIYPPQYRAVVISRNMRFKFVKVGRFNRELISDDGNFKLNLRPDTKIIMRNNQDFLCNIYGRDVAVVYSVSTKSFPAQITPIEIIVLCK